MDLPTRQIRTVDPVRTSVEGTGRADIGHGGGHGGRTRIGRTLERLLWPRPGPAAGMPGASLRLPDRAGPGGGAGGGGLPNAPPVRPRPSRTLAVRM